MEDQGIITLFFERSEQAIEETDKKYSGYCYSIAYNILSNREDSEESVSDTYLAAWNTIPPRRPNLLNAFLGKLTRHSYVISAEEYRQGKQKAQIKRLSTRKICLIAAVIALTLLLVGCAVVYVLSLNDMKIGEYSVTEPEHYGPNWEVIEAKEKTIEVLSVQGYSDSPNQQAVKEFRDYIDSTSGDNITNTEKMQEIAQKYGLKMLSDSIDVSYNQGYVLLESLHLPGVCKSQPYAEIKYQGGTFHPEGTFDISVDIEPDNELLKWPYTIYADFQYYQKLCWGIQQLRRENPIALNFSRRTVAPLEI